MDIFINFTTNCLTIGLTSTYSSRGWTWAKTMICVLSGTGTRHTLVSDNQEAAGQVASAVVTLPQRRPELGGRRISQNLYRSTSTTSTPTWNQPFSISTTGVRMVDRRRMVDKMMA
ncbi:uncharacterized protein [Spinacia oleracea]|uniref:Uncharacterized protein n=1 Tax=Spinacia oleracea TaxID=3562 RepID=A0A9R0JE69_SPIOL|nr:uncharacterized protein LOC110804055 [Spinacia oleracea]